MDGWKLKRTVDGKRDYIYTFRNFTLKPGKVVKVREKLPINNIQYVLLLVILDLNFDYHYQSLIKQCS